MSDFETYPATQNCSKKAKNEYSLILLKIWAGVNILAKTPNISPPPQNWDPNLPLVFNRSREFSRSFFLPNNDEISFFLLLN